MAEGLPGGVIPPHLAQGTQRPETSSLSAQVKRAQEKGDTESLRKVSKDFESLLVHQLLREMRKSIPKSEFLGGGSAREIYEDMMDEAVAKAVSEGRGVGLSEVIFRQMGGSPVARPGARPMAGGGNGTRPASTSSKAERDDR